VVVGAAPPGAESVADLVNRARAGDMEAFGDLYRLLAPTVTAAARRSVSDREVVADVVQETFARALEKLDQLREPASAAAWMAGIARRVATDHLRARYRVVAEDDRTLVGRSDDNAGPEVLTEGRVDLDDALRGIALLSPSDAQAVTLVAHLGLTTAELAAALGVAPVTAKVRLHRARRRLARLLEVVEVGDSRRPLPPSSGSVDR